MPSGSQQPPKSTTPILRTNTTLPAATNSNMDERTLHRVLMEMQGQVQNLTSMVDQAQGSGMRSVAETSLAIVPATSRSGPIVYNYQSPSHSTVHHSIMQCEPASRNVTASITSLPDTEHEHVAGHKALSGVNLMGTFRSLPKNPSYTSGASAPAVSQSKPHHFQRHFPVSKPSAKKAHIIPNSVAVRPKGKICVFGKNEHSRVGSLTSVDPDQITNSTSSRIAASDLGFRMASEGLAGILGPYRCCPRAAEMAHRSRVLKAGRLYPSQPNDVFEEIIRNAFGARAPPGRFDLVKFRGSTMELNQDTWPIHSLTNGSVSLAAYFRGCKHAFLVTNEWHDPSPYMETLEEEFTTGRYAATKEANIKINGHFNIKDDEYMKEFLNRHAIKDTELPNTSGDAQEAGYESPAYISPNLYDEMADNDITHSNASPPSRPRATVESEESNDETHIRSTINGWLKPAASASSSKLPLSNGVGFKEGKTRCYQSESDDSDDIDQEAKFKLGQRIQKAILFSNQGYHHFKKAKKEFDALPAASHARYNKHQAAYSKATESKPTQEQLDAAGSSYPQKRFKRLRPHDQDGQTPSPPRSVIEIDSSDAETVVQVKPEPKHEPNRDMPVLTDSTRSEDGGIAAPAQKRRLPRRKAHAPVSAPPTATAKQPPTDVQNDGLLPAIAVSSTTGQVQAERAGNIPYTETVAERALRNRRRPTNDQPKV